MMKKWCITTVLALSLGLTACVPLIVAGGVAVGLWVGSDPRKSDVIQSDHDLGWQLNEQILARYKEDDVHVNINVYNGQVLLTGEVPSEAARRDVDAMARQQKIKAREVINELVVGEPSSASARLVDSRISSQVKSSILTNSRITSGSVHIMVTTERRVVYLMGLTKPSQIDRAANAAARVGGVERVVKLVEYLPEGPQDRPVETR